MSGSQGEQTGEPLSTACGASMYRSPVGLHVTEVLYSIMESCRLAGIDPQVYLRALVPRRLRDDKYVKLPHEMAALLAEASQHDEA